MMKSVRVLVLNNYPLDAVWDEVKRGEKPELAPEKRTPRVCYF
jgi:hypothetical protein